MTRKELEALGFALLGEFKHTKQDKKNYLELVRESLIPEILESSVVYAFTANDTVVYIGRTDKMRTRLFTDHVRPPRSAGGYHYTTYLRNALADGVRILVFSTNVEPLLWNGHKVPMESSVELHLIRLANPAWNTKDKPKDNLTTGN